MGHLLYLMFRCDRGCDGKFGKFGIFVGTKHTPREDVVVLLCSFNGPFRHRMDTKSSYFLEIRLLKSVGMMFHALFAAKLWMLIYVISKTLLKKLRISILMDLMK